MHAYLRHKGNLFMLTFFWTSHVSSSLYALFFFHKKDKFLLLLLTWFSFYIGFRNLSIEVEEGICQVLSHLWLESEIIAGSSSNVASSCSAPTFKKGKMTEFEMKLGALIKNQIETHSSEVYGGGFRAGYPAVQRYGLRRTLDHIKLTGVSLPRKGL